MSIRYCGALRIKVTVLSPIASVRNAADYKCVIAPYPENEDLYSCTQYVSASIASKHALDAPEAIDAAAHAALSFAADDGWPIEVYAETNDSGWEIRRKAFSKAG